MKANSLNFRDILVVDHNPEIPGIAAPNLVPCCDAAGVVEEARVGSRWKKGNKVFVHPNSWVSGLDVRSFDPTKTLGGGTADGKLRRWAVWQEDQLIAAPAGLSLAETSTLFTSGVTAWHVLMHGFLKLRPGMTLVTQGTGGVSCFAIMVRLIICRMF